MAGRSRSSLILHGLVWIAIIAVIYAYFFWILKYSLHAPESEDISTVYKPLTIFFSANNIPDQYQSLITEQGEHRLIFSRISALISIYLFDYLNIPFLYVFGGLTVLLIVLLIYRDQTVTTGSAPLLLLVFLLLVLNPAYRTASFAAWGLSNFASVLLAILAIFAMHRRSWPDFFLFQALSFLSINTQGNGSLVPALGLIYYALDAESGNKLKVYAHLALSSFFFYLYFTSYSDQEYVVLAYGYLIENPTDVLVFFILAFTSWIGQWVVIPDEIMHGYTRGGIAIASFVGSCLLVFFAIFIKNNFDDIRSKFSARLYILAYIFITILGASWQRSLLWSGYYQSTDIDNLWFVLDIRYSFYPLCLIVALLSLYFSVNRVATGPVVNSPQSGTNKVYVMLVSGALLFWAARYYYALPQMDKDHKRWVSCIGKWQHHQQAKPCMWHGDNALIMKEAIRQGWMQIGETGTSR